MRATGPDPDRGGDRGLLAAWIAAVAVGLIAFGLSIWRLMPGLGFWDTAEFQMVLPVMGTAHPTGYPTYVLIGWLASILLSPIGEPALRINVLSAILVAIGVAVTVDLARRLAGSLVFGVAAGIGVALTPIVWAIGTHADPHALHFTLIAIILWLLVRWEQAHRGDAFDQPAAADGRARREPTGSRTAGPTTSIRPRVRPDGAPTGSCWRRPSWSACRSAITR